MKATIFPTKVTMVSKEQISSAITVSLCDIEDDVHYTKNEGTRTITINCSANYAYLEDKNGNRLQKLIGGENSVEIPMNGVFYCSVDNTFPQTGYFSYQHNNGSGDYNHCFTVEPDCDYVTIHCSDM